MLIKFKKYIKRILSSNNESLDNDFKGSYYSQEGEDVILARIFEGKKRGFYIDVGAHHPIRFSNTYKFYKMGWRGINIDAMPGSMKLFQEIRPSDINLEVPISNTEQELLFYIFNEPALNTFVAEEAEKKDGLRSYKIVEKKKLKTTTLDKIVAQHVAKGTAIDFLSIDAEGFDFNVLKSLDITVNVPEVIVIEEFNNGINDILANSEINKYLEKKGYLFFAKTFNTLFFRKNNE